MYRYAQINEDGIVVSDSHLSGVVNADNMIPITDDFDLTNKKYVDGEWVEYVPEEIEPQADKLDIIIEKLDGISDSEKMLDEIAEVYND